MEGIKAEEKRSTLTRTEDRVAMNSCIAVCTTLPKEFMRSKTSRDATIHAPPPPDLQLDGAALVASFSGADELAPPTSTCWGMETTLARRRRVGPRGAGCGPTTNVPPTGGTSVPTGRLPGSPAGGAGGVGGVSKIMHSSPPSPGAGCSLAAGVWADGS